MAKKFPKIMVKVLLTKREIQTLLRAMEVVEELELDWDDWPLNPDGEAWSNLRLALELSLNSFSEEV